MPIEGKVITALGSFFKNNFSFSNNFIIENLIKKKVIYGIQIILCAHIATVA